MRTYYCLKHFSVFEELVEMSKKWQLEYTQLDSGESKSIVSQIIRGREMSLFFCPNRTIRLVGTPPEGMWTLVLSAPDAPAWLLGRQSVSPNAITIYRPGYDFDCHFQPGHELYSFSLSPETLYNLCDCVDVPKLVDILMKQDVIECAPARKMELWQRATYRNHILNGLSSTEGHADLSVWHDFELNLIREILIALAEGKSIRSTKRYESRSRIFKEIDKNMETNPFRVLSVSDICRIAQVSERTLQYNFRKMIGITPKKYLRAMRLNRVRKDLCTTIPDGSNISDIANRWGFWHMGQFASDYHQLFGELPSETVKHFSKN